MYLSHYGLNEKPFQINQDTRFLWLGETHKEALARLEIGILDNRGILLFVGDVGTGKTTLINGLIDSLDKKNTLVATISDPGLEKLELFNFLFGAFNIDKQLTTKGDFLVHFIHFLHKSHAANKRVLIIIDEAQRLNHEMLEEIRQLSNLKEKNAKLLNILLVGQNELNEIMLENRNQALLQRITTRYSIGPLPQKEVGEYIRFRLAVAGCDKPIFSAGAVTQVVSFSNCYPRLINVICDHAMLSAFVRGKKKIDARIIKECAEDLCISVEKPSNVSKESTLKTLFGVLVHPWRYPSIGVPLYALLLVLLAGLGGFIYFREQWKPQSSHPATVEGVVDENSSFSVKPSRELAAVGSEGSEKSSTVPVPDAFTASEKGEEISVDSSEFEPDGPTVLSTAEIQANLEKTFLIGQGVAPSQIRTFGKGPENPIESNDTREGRAANRRVEIVLSKGSAE